MSDLELFSMPLCPFAHRVRLVLAEKAIAYRLTEIDLRNKPQAFLKVSPHGKVPALRHGGYHICESAIINEYLDETFPERPLLPRDPAGRAQARFWIEFANSRLFAATASLLYGPHRQNRSPALEQLAGTLTDRTARDGLRNLRRWSRSAAATATAKIAERRMACQR